MTKKREYYCDDCGCFVPYAGMCPYCYGKNIHRPVAKSWKRMWDAAMNVIKLNDKKS